jgi:hypothetical protein
VDGINKRRKETTAFFIIDGRASGRFGGVSRVPFRPPAILFGGTESLLAVLSGGAEK